MRDQNSFDWTFARIQQLTELWPDHSASQISAIMGCTRNAAIGKANRLRLPMKKHGGENRKPRAERATRKRKVYGPRSMYVPPEPPPVSLHLAVKFMQLRSHHCRMVLGDPCGAETLYCGHPRDAKHNYCKAHCPVVYRGVWYPTSQEQNHRAAIMRRAKMRKAMTAA